MLWVLSSQGLGFNCLLREFYWGLFRLGCNVFSYTIQNLVLGCIVLWILHSQGNGFYRDFLVVGVSLLFVNLFSLFVTSILHTELPALELG